MRNIPVIIGLAVACSMAVELPICEEYVGEENISCTATDSAAVITSYGSDGKTIEFYANGQKAYLEIGSDGHLLASSGRRMLNLDAIPVDIDGDNGYLEELLDGLLDDIAWQSDR